MASNSAEFLPVTLVGCVAMALTVPCFCVPVTLVGFAVNCAVFVCFSDAVRRRGVPDIRRQRAVHQPRELRPVRPAGARGLLGSWRLFPTLSAWRRCGRSARRRCDRRWISEPIARQAGPAAARPAARRRMSSIGVKLRDCTWAR